MTTYTWKVRPTEYGRRGYEPLQRKPALQHPLSKAPSAPIVKASPSKSSSVAVPSTGLDPLSLMAKEDPLTAAIRDEDEEEFLPSGRICIHTLKSSSDSDETSSDGQENWASKRTSILARFTTSEKLSIATSFLSEDGSKVIFRSASTPVDAIKTRLEQLDAFEESGIRHMRGLTQHEYTARIQALNSQLNAAWQAEERVKALKIAIQCSKVLSVTDPLSFYPSKFVLVTDLLEIFGKLVFQRLRNKSGLQNVPSGHIDPSQVPEEAKEMARNWYYKSASIRELLPRFYVETSLLNAYKFIGERVFEDTIPRLINTANGIGHPLVAWYARCFLNRMIESALKGSPLNSKLQSFAASNWRWMLQTVPQASSPSTKAALQKPGLDLAGYLSLFPPALDWVLQGACDPRSPLSLRELIQEAGDAGSHPLILNGILATFKPEVVSLNALLLLDLMEKMRQANDAICYPLHIPYRSLGLCLAVADPPPMERAAILSTAWKAIGSLKTASDYLTCVEGWLDFLLKNFGCDETNRLMSDVIRHLLPGKKSDSCYAPLSSILKKLLQRYAAREFTALFSMENFLPFLDLLDKDSYRMEACRLILEAFMNRTHPETVLTDPVIITTLLNLCKTLHDGSSAADEVRQASVLINHFLCSVSFRTDFEDQLVFYSIARAAFINLDSVQAMLVQLVNTLAMRTHLMVSGRHQRKSSSFVRACSAFCFITTPSLRSPFLQLDLYLLSARVGLLNGCLGQAEACFLRCLDLLSTLPRKQESTLSHQPPAPSEAFVLPFLRNFLSALVLMPMCVLFVSINISQESDLSKPLSVFRLLLAHIRSSDESWQPSLESRAAIYVDCLSYLNAVGSERFRVRIPGVDSNDVLYGSDPVYIQEVEALGTDVLQESMAVLQQLGSDPKHITKQSSAALELAANLVMHSGIATHLPLLKLVNNLWNLANKNSNKNLVQKEVLLSSLRSRTAVEEAPPNLKKLLQKLSSTP